jgi:RimJ/RimL family protein N-acetyltransferase
MNTLTQPENISLEPLGIQFEKPYLEMVNNPEIAKTTSPGDTSIFTKEQIHHWLHKIGKKDDRQDFAIVEKQTGRFVGEVVLNYIQNQSANIRIATLPAFWGKGYGTAAMNFAVCFGFQQLQLQKISLDVYDINKRGIHLYKKVGFVEVRREILDSHASIHMCLTRERWEEISEQ